MSFSSRTKDELSNDKLKKKCCRMAAFTALIAMSGSLQIAGRGKMRIRLNTESYSVAKTAVKLASNLRSIESDILVREHKRLGKTRSFIVVFYGDAADIENVLTDTGLMERTEDGLSLTEGIPRKVITGDCCERAFLRGAFLGGGSLSNPEKGYHLEFVVRSEVFAAELCGMLNKYELNAKTMTRKGSTVVYLKDGEKITDFLALIGAHGALLEIENVMTNRDFLNHLNRKFNCEIANTQKTVDASVRQVESIKYLLEHDAFSTLSKELRDTAEVRIDNPEASLKELGEMLEPPVGKSGVNHRLRKLEDIALALKQQKGGF